MKTYVCPVCGYVHEGDQPPEKCPQCGVSGDKFIVKEKSDNLVFACEHEVGVAKAVTDQEIIDGLRSNFTGECTEVGMYLAMARAAHREGYPEIGLYWEKAHTRRQNTLQSLQSFSVMWFQRPQRKTLKRELRLNTVQRKASFSLQREQRSSILTLFTIQFMKWLVMRQDTARHLRDSSRDISANKNSSQAAAGNRGSFFVI